MEGLVLCLFVLCVTLLLLWRDARDDTRYWQKQAESYQQRLYAAWEQQRELLERMDRDDTDWWKE